MLSRTPSVLCGLLLGLALTGAAAAQTVATAVATTPATAATALACEEAQVSAAACDAAAPSSGGSRCCHRGFAAGSIVIPMDDCHQPLGGSAAGASWCVDPGTDDDGRFRAYGLVYRAMQLGIPVHWIVNPTRPAGDDDAADGWILGGESVAIPARGQALRGGGPSPVDKLSFGTGGAVAGSYDATAFPLRDGSFVVDAADAPRFLDLWRRQGELAAKDPVRFDFSQVDLWRIAPGATLAWQDFSQSPTAVVDGGGAPVALTIDYPPPRVASRLGSQAPEWLRRAGLDDPAPTPDCKTGGFGADDVYCPLSDGDIEAGRLVDGGFGLLLLDRWSQDAGSCDSSADRAFQREVRELMTATPGVRAAGHVLFLDAAVADLDACADATLPPRSGAGVTSWARYQAKADNGIAFYLGGAAPSSPASLRAGLDALLALPAATVPQSAVLVAEVSRSAPIVAPLGGTLIHFQGTYVAVEPPGAPTTIADGERFEFPFVQGHVRAIDADAAIHTDPTAFAEVPVVFDAAEHIPPAIASGCPAWFAGVCRTVFTNVGTGRLPAVQYLTTGAAAELAPRLGVTAAEAPLLIERVLAGHDNAGTWEPALGGIDRSTLALIEPSPLAGGPRPTMIYVGALDGMLHALCAEAVAGTACDVAGRELWAFIPRTQLPLLRDNQQRIEGSPRVADMFGDFGGGRREWRTVLTFQTGHGTPGQAGREPAVLALDVTEPEQPRVLWELATPAERGPVALGVGLGTVMGPVQRGQDTVPLTLVLTSNGGTGGAGVYVAAIDTASGEVVWDRTDLLFPAVPRGRAGDAPVPATGIPGGLAGFDHDRRGTLTHVVFGTLYGEVWVLSAADGGNPYGGSPLLRFSHNFAPIGAPPAIYRDPLDGQLYVLVASGGYVDAGAATWAAGTQHLVAVPVDTPPAAAPLAETSRLGLAMDLEPGQRAFSQALVVGTELYLTTDTTDVNLDAYGLGAASGEAIRLQLGSDQPLSRFPIQGGGSAVDVRGGTEEATVYAGGGSAVQKNTAAAFHAGGITTELEFIARAGRQVWMRAD